MANYTHSIDPDRKPVSTTWDHPANPSIDFLAPHWYELEPDTESDLRVRQMAERWRVWGKPVIFAEQGNKLRNWDSGSALRMRLRTWTALFEEVSLVFWNASWSKRTFPNIYLGPEERNYIRVLSDFAAKLDSGVTFTPVSVSDPGVRAYALRSHGVAAVYLHHWSSHTTGSPGVLVKLQTPERASLSAQWIDPATGSIIAGAPVPSGDVAIQSPPFRIDAALLIH
jgi:hypothetical protein